MGLFIRVLLCLGPSASAIPCGCHVDGDFSVCLFGVVCLRSSLRVLRARCLFAICGSAGESGAQLIGIVVGKPCLGASVSSQLKI